MGEFVGEGVLVRVGVGEGVKVGEGVFVGAGAISIVFDSLSFETFCKRILTLYVPGSPTALAIILPAYRPLDPIVRLGNSVQLVL